jgi:hypothetical protein
MTQEDYRKKYMEALEDRLKLSRVILEKDKTIMELQEKLKSRSKDTETPIKATPIKPKPASPARIVKTPKTPQPLDHSLVTVSDSSSLELANGQTVDLAYWTDFIKFYYPGTLGDLDKLGKLRVVAAIEEYLNLEFPDDAKRMYMDRDSPKAYSGINLCVPKDHFPQLETWFNVKVREGILNSRKATVILEVSGEGKSKKNIEFEDLESSASKKRRLSNRGDPNVSDILNTPPPRRAATTPIEKKAKTDLQSEKTPKSTEKLQKPVVASQKSPEKKAVEPLTKSSSMSSEPTAENESLTRYSE